MTKDEIIQMIDAAGFKRYPCDCKDVHWYVGEYAMLNYKTFSYVTTNKPLGFFYIENDDHIKTLAFFLDLFI